MRRLASCWPAEELKNTKPARTTEIARWERNLIQPTLLGCTPKVSLTRKCYPESPATDGNSIWQRTCVSVIIDRAPQPARKSKTIYDEEAMSAKHIFVTGGVVSSLGKGLAAASIGCLLESRGLEGNLIKVDPYLNLDPRNRSPVQHGGVVGSDDGAETEFNLGHYRLC